MNHQRLFSIYLFNGYVLGLRNCFFSACTKIPEIGWVGGFFTVVIMRQVIRDVHDMCCQSPSAFSLFVSCH